MQPDGVTFDISNLEFWSNIVWNIQGLRYRVAKIIGIRKLEFVVKTQFVYLSIHKDGISICLPIFHLSVYFISINLLSIFKMILIFKYGIYWFVYISCYHLSIYLSFTHLSIIYTSFFRALYHFYIFYISYISTIKMYIKIKQKP